MPFDYGKLLRNIFPVITKVDILNEKKKEIRREFDEKMRHYFNKELP